MLERQQNDGAEEMGPLLSEEANKQNSHRKTEVQDKRELARASESLVTESPSLITLKLLPLLTQKSVWPYSNQLASIAVSAHAPFTNF